MLEGPQAWRESLNEPDLSRHDEWASAVIHIQALMGPTYFPPQNDIQAWSAFTNEIDNGG